jgi:L,D-peptidoglycan transpeptidase YkuD (ErfK/YbiS/YcfS/YnhG family)
MTLMNIIIKKHLLLYNGYKLKCSIGKSGFNNNKKEGDLTTPKGTFKLGMLYYRKDRLSKVKCKIKKKIIKRNMGWCDDSNSKKYNREIIFPFEYSAEKLHRKDNIYDLFISIKYNYKPTIKRKGSAIFLHIAKKNYLPTKGCIAIKKNDFLKILPLIKVNTKISII